MHLKSKIKLRLSSILYSDSFLTQKPADYNFTFWMHKTTSKRKTLTSNNSQDCK